MPSNSNRKKEALQQGAEPASLKSGELADLALSNTKKKIIGPNRVS